PHLDNFNWNAFANLLSNAPFSPALKTVQIFWDCSGRAPLHAGCEGSQSELERYLAGRIPGAEVTVGPEAARAPEDGTPIVRNISSSQRLFDRHSEV
ncbi:hypothetical protein DXG03_006627, partial [Asterophora parasitica]